MKVKNAVWVTADRKTAVPAGHEDAAFLLVGANGELSDKVAKELHVTENGAQGQKDAKPSINASHMVTDATPDGINTAPDSPQAKEGLTTVTVAGNETKNKSSVTIQKKGEEAPSVQRDVQAKANMPVKDEPPAAKETAKPAAPKRG